MLRAGDAGQPFRVRQLRREILSLAQREIGIDAFVRGNLDHA
jgi:hypothetical protein